MATIGTSYEDYKANHPLTQDLTPDRNGYRPTSFATLSILEHAGTGTDQDFFDPEKLAVLSEEGLQALKVDMERNVIAHANNIFYKDYTGSVSSDQSIKADILGKDDLQKACDLVEYLQQNRPEELGNLVVGILNRDYIQGDMAASDVSAEIASALESFAQQYNSSLDQAWARKTEINNAVEAVVNEGMEGVVAHEDVLKGMTPEQEGYFMEQFEGYSRIQNMDSAVKSEVAEALGAMFEDPAPVPAPAPDVAPAPAPGLGTP